MIILSIQNKIKDSTSWIFNFIKDDGQGDFYVKKEKKWKLSFFIFSKQKHNLLIFSI
jgi:hypothetical protein